MLLQLINAATNKSSQNESRISSNDNYQTTNPQMYSNMMNMMPVYVPTTNNNSSIQNIPYQQQNKNVPVNMDNNVNLGSPKSTLYFSD